jgi:hypothetical protein
MSPISIVPANGGAGLVKPDRHEAQLLDLLAIAHTPAPLELVAHRLTTKRPALGGAEVRVVATVRLAQLLKLTLTRTLIGQRPPQVLSTHQEAGAANSECRYAQWWRVSLAPITFDRVLDLEDFDATRHRHSLRK